MVLCLENDMLVPNAGLETLNPKIKCEEWKLHVLDTAMPWPAHLPRRASINSFGFGGSNAHVILESVSEYFREVKVSQLQPKLILFSRRPSLPKLVPFSTHDKEGTERVAAKWNKYWNRRTEADCDISLRDVAFTMSSRRSHLTFRSFAIADSAEELRDQLQKGLPGFPRATRENDNVVFIFTGQGAQWAGMGLELLWIPAFAKTVAHLQEHLSSLGCPWNIADEIRKSPAESLMNRPDRSQPICTALQLALVDLLSAWGIHPRVTVGHSSGEIGMI